MSFSTICQRVIGSRPVRHCIDTSFRLFAQQRARKLDHASAAERQQHSLLQLVRHARSTRFGREHGFSKIRSIADYQQRVPLRDYEAFWKDYWQQPYPVLQDVTWPGVIPYFALSSGTTSGTTKHIPVSCEMLASNRKAALTSLALFRAGQRRRGKKRE